MNVVHDAEVKPIPGGQFVSHCTGCLRYGEQMPTYLAAQEDATAHEMEAKVGLLYRGPRKPALKSMVAYYEEQAGRTVYTNRERLLWKQLADELRRVLPQLKGDAANPDQLSLLDLHEGERP